MLIVEAGALQRDEDGTEVRTLSKEVGICTDVTSNPPFSQFDTKFSINSMIQGNIYIYIYLKLTFCSERVPQNGFF